MWVLVHLGALVLVAGFLALGWWQITRAASGNLLSYGYAFEWPAFAAFVVWVWVSEMRKALRQPPPEPSEAAEARATPEVSPAVATPPADPPRPRRRRNETAYDDSDDPQLAAYNHYLAWRNANPHATAADYPGMS
jgi:DNA-binding transcriptional regulator of glucitol operon